MKYSLRPPHLITCCAYDLNPRDEGAELCILMNPFGQSSEHSVEDLCADAVLDNHIPRLEFLFNVLLVDGKST